jgi:hypothetical protein
LGNFKSGKEERVFFIVHCIDIIDNNNIIVMGRRKKEGEVG